MEPGILSAAGNSSINFFTLIMPQNGFSALTLMDIGSKGSSAKLRCQKPAADAISTTDFPRRSFAAAVRSAPASMPFRSACALLS